MKFESPSFTDLYEKFKDNKRLEKYLIELGALITSETFYDEYGYKEKTTSISKYIEKANDKVYRNLATVFEGNENYIKQNSISYLVDTHFLRNEIVEALGFESDIVLPAKAYKEIFYTYKYCYTQSFFQNNWKDFIPINDFEELNKNSAASAFIDAVMKEFDKIDYIITHSVDWIDYKKIPFDYINYLSQLLGLEVKTFYMKTETEDKYRELAANIIDIYKGRGTVATFEILFNLLGFNLDLREYYFDRRKYYTASGENLELSTNDYKSYKYYLTTINPSVNYLTGIATNETVSLSDFGEIHNLMNFDELVEKYGLRCVLGYDDTYIDDYGNTQEYTEDVYTYFKTNYVRLRPTKKFEGGNFSLNQLYQLASLMDFLTPEFLQREIYVVIDTGESSEKMILNWTMDLNTDGFYMLDSEEFRNNFANLYISNFNDYQNSEYKIEPYRIKDDGQKIKYYNSLGVNTHYANGKNNNVFFNPLSEKIKIYNTTKYWGNNRIEDENENDAIYPVWRSDRNYINEGKYTISGLINSGEPLYFPRDVLKFPSSHEDRIHWQKTPKISLNGYIGKTIRTIIADGTNNDREIKWVTSLPIELYLLDEEIPTTRNVYTGKIEDNYNDCLNNYLIDNNYENYNNLNEKEKIALKNKIKQIVKDDNKKYNNNNNIFEKAWRNVNNYSLICVAIYDNYNDLVSFIKTNKCMIVNYDYIKNEFMGETSLDWLIYNSEEINNKTYNYIKTNANKIPATISSAYINDSKVSNILSSMLNENTCFIGYNDGVYFVYKCLCIYTKNYLNYNMLKFVPSLRAQLRGTYDCAVVSYSDILKNLNYDTDGNASFYDELNLKTINLLERKDYVIYVSNDQMFYKLTYVPEKRKSVIHAFNRKQPSVKYIDVLNDKNNSANIIGNFYYYDASVNNEINGTDYYNNKKNEKLNYINTLTEERVSKMYKYKYINIHKGDLIYSIYDGKVYEILGNGIFEQSNAKMSKITDDNLLEKGINSNNNIYGIKEVNFYGRVDKKNNKYKIYEYDEEYKGFDEQDDDENYILNNYNRKIEWASLNIKFNTIKRPIREKINSYFEELNNEVKIGDRISRQKNELTYNIFKEICNSAEKDFNRKDLITWSK